MTDTSAFILWYLGTLLFGFIGLPITNYFFPKWRTKGYIFAKFVGLFAVSMPLWFLASLKIVQFSQLAVYVFTIGGAVVAAYYLRKQKFQLTKAMIVQELMFLVILAVWAYIRSFNSQINGTEKFMNLAFMNSILRSEYFPPADPWFTGESINYYYLGHYMYVFAGKLFGMTMGHVYNLALVTIIAQFAVSCFTLIQRLAGNLHNQFADKIALLGSLWISFGGNVHYPFMYLQSLLTGTEFKYFFPDPTRIIPFAIDEFPAYSIALGDVHGHYISLPFFALMLAFLLQARVIPLLSKRKLQYNALISVFIIAMYGINSWDVITAVFLFTLLHLYQVYETGKHWSKVFRDFVFAELALILPGLLFLLPYILNFTPAVGGLGLVPFDRRSPVGPWLLMWGFFVVITLIFMLVAARKSLPIKTAFATPVLLCIAALSLIIGVEVLFFRDIFVESNYDYFRTNTVFKFYYHAWIIWGLACSWFVFAIVKLSRLPYQLRGLMLVVFVVIVAAAFSYIFKAVNDFYPLQRPGLVALDGTAYLDTMYPGDAKAIDWLQANVSGQPVILESVGEAYTYAARVSTHTGLPTVIGWPTHEWQWRGSPTLPYSRADDVKAIYTTTSATELRTLLDKYQVEYVYIGNEERVKYPELNGALFAQLMKQVYNQDNVTIYQVP